MSDKKTIGEAVKAARAKKGLTQEELAKQAGITQSALSHIESGRSEPTVGTLKGIAAALGVSWKKLAPD